MSKLDEQTKQSILQSVKEGKSSRFIAAEHGLGKSTVGDFLRKETYRTWWARKGLDNIRNRELNPVVSLADHVHPNLTVGTITKAPGVGKTRCKADLAPLQAMSRLSQALNMMGNLHRDNPKTNVQLPGEIHNVDLKCTFSVDGIFKIVTSSIVKDDCTHFVIPDTQVKPGICMAYLDHVGAYMADKQPEVIVMIGDHADLPSLSSYDKGTKKAEGKRLNEDFAAAIEGMRRLLRPIYDLQQRELRIYGRIKYKPKMVLTLGNHEERLMRHVNANPELAGFVSYDNLKYKEFGWEVIDFLKPINVHGVNYVHYVANPFTGRPYGGQASNILKQVGETFVVGHKQCLDVTTRFLPASGKQQWLIIAGACYSHDEDYKGHQGNKHWRGVVILHQVKDGNFNPMFVDLAYLKKRYDTSVKDTAILDWVGIR